MSPRILNGRYKIVNKLGEGGFGNTYLAEDMNLFDSLCVIKRLNPQNADVETAKRLFKREAYILSYVQENEQIPKLFGYFEEDQNCYLVEEYIRGDTLEKLISEDWPQQEVVNFLREILLILDPLHQQEIIHRDLKPSNIMRRDKDNKFVLIDFGAVKQLGNSAPIPVQPSNETMIGTPGYAPREQMMGKTFLSSDIYALGMTAIHLLTNVHPIMVERDNDDNVIWPEQKQIDPWLKEILNQMVNSNPQKRYHSAQDLLKKLDEIEDLASSDTGLRVPKEGTHISRLLAKHKPVGQIAALLTGVGTLVLIIAIELIYPVIRPWYYSYRGNHLLDISQPENALEQFRNLISLNRNSASGWKGRGDAMLMLGRYSGALSAYEKALQLKPNNIKALNNKGTALYRLRRYEQAVATHEKALELNPDSVEAWSGIGIAYLGWGKYEQATESFDQAQNIAPDNPQVWLEEALAIESGQGFAAAKEIYEEALRSYDDILDDNRNKATNWMGRGYVLLKLRRPQDALKSYNRAVEIDSNLYEAWMGKGNASSSLGEPGPALEAFNRASEIRPKDYLVWYSRGILLAQAFKDHQEALDSFQTSIRLRNDFHPAWLDRGLAQAELGRYREALISINRAQDLQPNDPLVWANKGFVLEKLGKYSQAIEAYDRAIEMGFEQVKPMREILKKKIGNR